VIDLLMLALLVAAFTGAAGYIRACADLTQASAPPDQAP
jgi:hypothetical protein